MRKILVTASVAMLWASGAWALGTTAGTDIANYATLSYDAGGVSQPDVNSTTDSFVVDKKIDMVLVTTDTDQIDVHPGQQDMTTNYAFQNEGNADQNFTFTAANIATVADYNNKTDNDDVNNIEIQCVYGATTYPWAASLTIEVGEDDNITCQVRADIDTVANGGADGDVMNIRLTAVAVDDTGANESETGGAETQGSMDIVFADGETDATLGDNNASNGDAAGDGQEVANSGYEILTPVLSATKTSCVVSDPVNGTSTPKRIPGAVIRYMFDIENTGSAAVSDLNVTDTFSTNFTDGTNIQISNVFKNENQTSCSCTSPGNTAATHSESAMTTTIQGISVAAPLGENESHSCVSVEVEIK